VLKGGKEWKGMKVFSIHNSKARSHTAEWLMHELFKLEDIIVPDYDFINTKLNGVNLGVYAYEHHFENQMLKKNKREVGPILKHNDDAYWDNVLSKPKPFPWIEASHIELFNKNNINDPGFKKLVQSGTTMLYDFLNGKTSVEKVFDMELMAKYYALLDLSHSWHAQQFTNIRFYLNPTTGKLEPIAFDCFGDHLPDVNADWEAFGEGFNSGTSKETEYGRSNVYRYLLLQDQAFFKLYVYYLDQFTKPEYLDGFKKKFDSGLASRVEFIRTDKLYKDFNSNFDQLFAKANFTKKKLLPKGMLSLKAFRLNGSKQNLHVESYHSFPLEIVGFGNEIEMTEVLDNAVFLEAYNPKTPVQSVQLRALNEVEYIYYKVIGTQQLHKLKLSKNDKPSDEINIANANAWKALPFISQDGNRIIIKEGKYKVSQAIVIPSGYELIISPGAELHFKAGGNLCSYSPIQARGSKQQPIVFYSENIQGSGLLLLNAKEKSNFEYCRFVGLKGYENTNVNM